MIEEHAGRNPQNAPTIRSLHGRLWRSYKASGGNIAEAKRRHTITAQTKDPNNFTWHFKLHDSGIRAVPAGVEGAGARASKAQEQAAREEYQKLRMEMLEFKLMSFLEREKQYSTDSRVKFELGQVYFDLAVQKKDKALFDQAIGRFRVHLPRPEVPASNPGLKLGLGFAAKGQYDLGAEALRRDAGRHSAGNSRRTLEAVAVLQGRRAGKEQATAGSQSRRSLRFTEVDVAYKDVSKRIESLDTLLGTGNNESQSPAA